MVDRVKLGVKGALHAPPPSPAWANFSLPLCTLLPPAPIADAQTEPDNTNLGIFL